MPKVPTTTRTFLTSVGTLTVLIMVAIFVKGFFTPHTPMTLSCQQFGTTARAFVQQLHAGQVLIQLTERPGDEDVWAKMTPDEFTCPSIFGKGWFDVK